MKTIAAVVAGGLVFALSTCPAATIMMTANLSGSAEAPPNASPGTGFASVIYDDVAHTLNINVSFSGLLGTTTASHIHCCTTVPETGTAGVATTTPTFAGFPLGVSAGTYNNTLDLTQASSWNSSFVSAHGGTTAGAEAFFAAGFGNGQSYLNIHTNVFPGGEIRGFLVPEPGSFALALIGCLVVFGRRRLARR